MNVTVQTTPLVSSLRSSLNALVAPLLLEKGASVQVQDQHGVKQLFRIVMGGEGKLDHL